MTMIAIACRGDHLEFATDSIRYSRSLRHVGTTSKSVMLPHLDAAMLSQGDSEFASEARLLLEYGQNGAATFDDLARDMPAALLAVWSHHERHSTAQSRIFLVGYSDEADEFVSWELSSDQDFQPRRLPPMFIIPTPWNLKPNDFELADEHVQANEDEPDNPDDHEKWVDHKEWVAQTHLTWQGRPEPTPPSDREEWLDLVIGARGRAVSTFGHWPVGGKVFLSTLVRGGNTTTLLIELDDTIEARLQLAGLSLHPLAQVRPCYCDSGKRRIDCHLVEQLDDPCRCGSEKSLRECCILTDDEAERWTQEIAHLDPSAFRLPGTADA